MATILAHITVRDGKQDSFEALARELYAATHTREVGVLSYQYWRGAEPRTYYTMLAFENYNAFLEHQTSDHHDDVALGLRDAIEHMTLEWVDPIDGASPLPETQHQDPPDGVSDEVLAVAKAYAAVIADWWPPRTPL